MKVIIKSRFRDKDDFSIVYEQNEEHDFDEKRALELLELGLVEKVEQPKAEEQVTEQDVSNTDTDSPEEVTKRRGRKAIKRYEYS